MQVKTPKLRPGAAPCRLTPQLKKHRLSRKHMREGESASYLCASFISPGSNSSMRADLR
jgi:hypothetical protein